MASMRSFVALVMRIFWHFLRLCGRPCRWSACACVTARRGLDSSYASQARCLPRSTAPLAVIVAFSCTPIPFCFLASCK